MSAETLREAAAEIRSDWPKCERRSVCTCHDFHLDYHHDSDAWNAVADWLMDLAARITLSRQLRHEDEERQALAVARAYLGES